MIQLIEALNFRCLHHVRQPLGPFHVLVGPNASGKSSFLDVLTFLSRLVAEGLEAAIGERTQNFHDLVWGREGDRFELAVEARIPEELLADADARRYATIRYAVALGGRGRAQQLCILDEQLLLCAEPAANARAGSRATRQPRSLIRGKVDRDSLPLAIATKRTEYRLFRERADERVSRQVGTSRNGMEQMVRRDSDHAVFRVLNSEEFPVGTWFGDLLARGIHLMHLDRRKLHSASRPGLGQALRGDGENLPWVIADLNRGYRDRYQTWLRHVRTALPDVDTVRIIERPEDKHRYLMVRYRGGLEVPAWGLSDATLQVLALTILAYVPALNGTWLIEEPETSLHPLNIEPIVLSLQSLYDAQVLLATQSPAVLAIVDPADVLVFSREEATGTHIIKGTEHSQLADWQGQPNLSVLFASGVLS
ncbi:MAG TPA: AAA family ATPase [Pirellulales bacterium]|nr:AAA family ATPase [Pirellulales bacterium]